MYNCGCSNCSCCPLANLQTSVLASQSGSLRLLWVLHTKMITVYAFSQQVYTHKYFSLFFLPSKMYNVMLSPASFNLKPSNTCVVLVNRCSLHRFYQKLLCWSHWGAHTLTKTSPLVVTKLIAICKLLWERKCSCNSMSARCVHTSAKAFPTA